MSGPDASLRPGVLSAEVAAALSDRLSAKPPGDIIQAALDHVSRERLALVSSFGIESAALLWLAARVDRSIPVIFLDTGWLFQETLDYRDELTERLGLTDVRTVKPAPEAVQKIDGDAQLWFNDPDSCCGLRKVEPLQRTLRQFDAWINGRKRFQGGLRGDLSVVEFDGERLKFNPLANVSAQDLQHIYHAEDLPRHPLVAQGFGSVGCMPCSSRTRAGEDARAGRWRDRGKTECGIHTIKAP